MEQGPRQEAVCIKCGYDLMGLPERGSCPECGSYYDMMKNVGLRSGRAEQIDRSHRLVARLRTISLIVVAVVVMSCGGLLSLIADNPFKPITLAAVVGGVFLLAGATSYLYENE